jgi:group I intron endonuclease
MVAGVYWILNLVNGKVYIGSSVDVENRLQNHKKDLIAGNHRNPYLQRAWDKQPDSTLWNFEILEEVDEIWLRARESAWILRLQSHLRDTGYNAAQNGWDGGTWPGQVEACRIAGKLMAQTQKFKDDIKVRRVGKKHLPTAIIKLKKAWVRRKADKDYYKFTAEDTAKGIQNAAKELRENWQDPEWKSQVTTKMKSAWTPERRAAQSERAKKQLTENPNRMSEIGIKGAAVLWQKEC